ncbi:hypothetical protein MKX01_033527 [Papaver californicum]|nr:hypothetical protein MKX01_033527 [Papaver californicum]
MSDEESDPQLSDNQKLEIAKWFLTNSPAGEVQYISKDVSGDVVATTFAELSDTEYLDPRIAQVAVVDHVKQQRQYIEFKDELQVVELRGKLQVGVHYFEEGNVQLDASPECKDSTNFQSPEDCALSVTNIIRHHETEYLASLEGSYLNLPDTTFKLPVTRTLFPWHNTMQISLTRDITKELGIKKRGNLLLMYTIPVPAILKETV